MNSMHESNQQISGEKAEIKQWFSSQGLENDLELK